MRTCSRLWDTWCARVTRDDRSDSCSRWSMIRHRRAFASATSACGESGHERTYLVMFRALIWPLANGAEPWTCKACKSGLPTDSDEVMELGVCPWIEYQRVYLRRN